MTVTRKSNGARIESYWFNELIDEINYSGSAINYAEKTSDYTVDLTEGKIGLNASSNTVQATIPAASGNIGKGIWIKAIDITYAATVYETGVGLVKTFTVAGEVIFLVSNGIGWIDFSNNIQGGILLAASIQNPSRLDVKKDTKANLETYALTATDFQLCAATDEYKAYIIYNNVLNELGGGGSGGGDANTLHLILADDIQLTDIDITGNNTAFDGGGSPVGNITLSTTSSELLKGAIQVIKYDANGSDGSNDYAGITKTIKRGLRGRDLGFQFLMTMTSVMADNEVRFCVKQIDGSNAGHVQYFYLPAYYNANGTGKTYFFPAFIWDDCTEVGIGWQNLSTNTAAGFRVDNILVSSKGIIDKQIIETQEIYHTAAGSTLLDASNELEFDLSNLYSMYANFIVPTDDSTNSRTKFIVSKNCEVTVSLSGYATTTTRDLYVTKNGTIDKRGTYAYGAGESMGVSHRLTLEAGEFFTVGVEGGTMNSNAVMLKIVATALIDGVAFSTELPENEYKATIYAYTTGTTWLKKSGWDEIISSISVSSPVTTINLVPGAFTEAPHVTTTTIDLSTPSGVAINSLIRSVSTTQIVIDQRFATSSGGVRDFNITITKAGLDYLPLTGTIITPLTRTAYIDVHATDYAANSVSSSSAYQVQPMVKISGDGSFCVLDTYGVKLPAGKYEIEYPVAPQGAIGWLDTKIYNYDLSADIEEFNNVAYMNTASGAVGWQNVKTTFTLNQTYVANIQTKSSGGGLELIGRIKITKLI